MWQTTPKVGSKNPTKTTVHAGGRPTFRWVLPLAFTLGTGLLLFQAPSHNHCREIARGDDTCISMPEVVAFLINGPGLCGDCRLQYEYFSSEYFVDRLVGVFFFWFWAGWLFDEHRAAGLTQVPRTVWLHLITYVPWIFLSAARTYGTVRHDRLSMSHAVEVLHRSGALVLLQAAGKIWVERAQVVWLLVLIICFAKEATAKLRRPF
jgi:hypothetical protein